MSTVGKALDILEVIARNCDGISLSELAEVTKLNRTTVHRILSVLVDRRYIHQQGKKGKYTLGLKFIQYGKLNNTAALIKDKALPYLQRLCNEISETVNIAVLDGVEAVGIAIVASDRILQVVPTLPSKFPLHCTSLGKVLLANLPDDEIDRMIEVIGLASFTENTVTDGDRLKKELKVARREGYAIDNEEYLLWIRSVAAPVRGEDGTVIAAISLVGPTVRIDKARMAQLVPLAKSYALEISRSLGYRGD
jgi:DNA-binding IclR family transcriptional regulator